MSKLKHIQGEWRVRKAVDETGDYPFPTYDILAIHEWGPECIACAFQNPNNARLIAAAPEMLEALIEFLKFNGAQNTEEYQLRVLKLIEKATGMSIEGVLQNV